MTTVTRKHRVLELPDGRRLSWLLERGPRGWVRHDPRLDGRPVDGEVFVRLKMWAEHGVRPSS